MKQQIMTLPVPQGWTIIDNSRELFSQADLNFMLHGTKESIKAAVNERKQLEFITSELWNACDKSNPETTENYKRYLKARNYLANLKKDIKRMERISRTLKALRKL